MTQDKIIRSPLGHDQIIDLAREAGFFINKNGEIESPLKEGCAIDEYIERLIDISANHERITTIANMQPKMVQMMQDAAIVEREACAKVCEQIDTDAFGSDRPAPNDCAAAIRARSTSRSKHG